MLKIFSTKKQATKQAPTHTQEDSELFTELDDADLLAIVGGDSSADGAAIGSPGVLSGNLVQVPVHVPVNVCVDSVNVIALLNPAFGNTCK
ncbi:MAG: chaplin [Nostoc sp. CmiVER01]|uniref:chaplin n=1 Tax=Nostoc sp. CmiVER01 TaxID=3075384 RepID=UPI002AD45FBA|nr:chaplin [Nostoc sp. CmiVER01]MDZ8120711.1 chaplin [Nostoc sp. CmiVER01]